MSFIKQLDSKRMSPDYFPPDTAWLRHGPFSMWLVHALQPKAIVELGTHSGYSYFCFCKAVREAKLNTKCYAVDTWQGDEHAGFYNENVLGSVKTKNSEYSSFSTLLQKTFAEALYDIEDGSVDLLHVDGRHFYEDVKEDFESWIPKLSPRAVVLFHDTTEHGNNFGVWKYWEEISQLRPSFNFPYQHGLGVIFWGTEIANDLKSVVDNIADKAQQERVINYFALRGEILWLQQTLDNSNAKKDGAHLRTKKYFKYWMKLRLLRILSKSAPNLAANIFIRFFSSAKKLKQTTT